MKTVIKAGAEANSGKNSCGFFADNGKIPNLNRCILLVLAAAFLVRLYAAKTMWLIPDEGNWLYDATLAMKGYTPLVDYNSRSVLYIYSLIPFIKLLGNTLLAGRIVSVIAETVSAYFVFRIAKKLYDERTGLIAAAIFGLAPFGVFFGSILKSETFQRMFAVIALYFLATWIYERKDRLLFASGIFFGFALLIRESVAIFLVLMPLFFYFGMKMNLIETAKKTGTVAAGAFLAVLPFLIFLLSASHIYGLFPPKALVESPFSAGGLSKFVVSHVGFVSLFIKEAVYLIVPALLFCAFLIKGRTGAKFPLRRSLAAVALFSIAYAAADAYSYFALSNPLNLSAPISFISVLLIALILSSAAFLLSAKNLPAIGGSHKLSNRFVIFMASPVVFYLFYWAWHVEYFTEFMPAMSVAAAALALSVSSMKNKYGKIFLALLIASALFTQALHFYQPYTQARGIDRLNSEENVKAVAAYISANTADSEEIFSNTIFAFEANRRIIFDISHAMMYHYKATVNNPAAMRALGYPTIDEIIAYMEDKKTNYVVVDAGFGETYLSINPKLEKYIYSNYHVEKEISGVKIYSRN